MTVSVLVPYRPDGEHRDRAWAWVREWWAREHPDWQVVEGKCPDGPWVKAAAVADALSRADGDVLVVADADVWCDGVSDAVNAVRQGTALWAVPHSKVHRLSETATTAVLAGAQPGPVLGGLARHPYLGVQGGGMTVLPADLYRETPLDPRYRGWGQEDESWGIALTTIAGRSWRGTSNLWHLWHRPSPRLNRHIGSTDTWALHVRYQYAAKTGPSAMRALLDEHGGCDG